MLTRIERRGACAFLLPLLPLLFALSSQPALAQVPPSLSIGDASVTESYGNTSTATMEFTVTLSPAAEGEVTVDWRASDDTAVQGTLPPSHGGRGDYRDNSGTLIFLPGQTRSKVSVRVYGDNVDEPDETFTVVLSNASEGVTIERGTATGTIKDTDGTPTVTLKLAPDKIGENSGVSTVTATLSNPSSEDTTVTVSVPNSPDYTLSPNPLLTIPAGRRASTGVVTITANDNNVRADNKTVTVSGVARNDQGITAPQDVTLTIIDDDVEALPSLSIDDSSEVEGQGLWFTVKLSRAVSYPVTVRYTLIEDGTARELYDYEPYSGTLTFDAGETRKRVLMAYAYEDSKDEPDETFRVTLSEASGATIADGAATGTIIDNDGPPNVTLVLTPPSISEHGGVSTVTATLKGPLSEDATVTVRVTPVAPAVAGDYTLSTNTTLTIAAGRMTSTGTVTIEARDNDEDAPDKTVTVSGTAENSQGSMNTNDVTLTITDDDGVPSLSIGDVSVTEGDTGSATMTFTVTLSPAVESEVTVDWETADGTAEAGTDYTAGNGSLRFDTGEASKTFTVTVTGDEEDEEDETFTVTLSNVSGAMFNNPTATGTITDDDGVPSLSIGDASVTESYWEYETATMEFTVTLSPAAEGEVTVDWRTSGDTAMQGTLPPSHGGRGDYRDNSDTLIFLPGQTRSKVSVGVYGDNVDEPDETFTVVLSNASEGVTIERGTATGTIKDADGTPTVTLKLTPDQIGEDSGVSTVTATLSNPSSKVTTVRVSVPNSPDYTLSSNLLLTIPAGQRGSTGVVTITANDNNVRADNKTVTVSGTADNDQGITPPQDVTLTIIDDDTEALPSLSIDDLSEVEGQGLWFTVKLSRAVSYPVTVRYTLTEDGTAREFYDYEPYPGTLTFDAGETRKRVLMAYAYEDSEDEPDETFMVMLSEASGATIADGAATGTIKDNDDSPATGAVTITGTLTEGETLTADTSGIADTDGLDNAAWAWQWVRTPAGGSDVDISGATSQTYVPVFADAGATLKVRVTVTDDEGHEATFESAPTSAVAALPRPSVTVVSDGDVTEGSTAVFTLTRTGDPAQTLDVAYEVTATGDFGVTTGAGTATFLANNATVQVSVDTTEDGAHEAHGSVTLTLTADTGAAPAYLLGAPSTATAAVEDDDDSPATGAVTVTGTAAEGETLSADTSGLTDADGLGNADYAYQWVRTPSGGSDEDISDATAATYVPVFADAGATLKVKVTVTDDEGHEATFESAPTSAVAAAARPSVTVASGGDVTEGDTVTFTLTRTGDPAQTLDVAYEVAASGDFGVTPGAATATFLANSATVQVTVATTGDGAHEAHGSVTVTLTADTGADPAWLLGDPSTATAAVEDDDDSPATGAVTVTGTATEGETLNADTSGLTDEDGLDNASYVYQWVRTPSGGSDADISGATSQTYVPVFADAGATLKVRVTVTDDEGHEATFESAPTSAVAAAARPSVTVASGGDVTEGDTVTFTLTRTGDPAQTLDVAYEVAASGDFGVTPGADTATFPANSATAQVSVATTGDGAHEAHGSVTLTLTADTNADLAYVLGAPSTATAAVEDDDDSPATGSVTVTGTATEGETLTADTSGVTDGDGLANAAWAYQWIRTPSGGSDEDISGATSQTYVPVFADAGATLKVRVQVTDDEGHQTTFTSAPTSAVAAVPRPSVTVASDGDVTEGSPALFTLTRTGAAAQTLDVAYTVTVSGDFGVTPFSGTATFLANNTTVQVSVATTNDDTHEAHGSVTVTLTADAAYNLGPEAQRSASVTVADDDNASPTGAPTIDDTTPAAGRTLSADASGVGDPDGLTDRRFVWQWLRVSEGTATEIAGATSASYTVVAADIGSALKVRVGFTDDGGTGETAESVPTSAVGAYTIEVTAPTVTEGDGSATILLFAVARSDTAQRVQLGWRLAASSTAQAGKGKDMGGPTQGTLDFPRGTTRRFVVFHVIDDWIDESDETVVIEFFAVAGTPAGVTFPPAVTGTILDNDTSTVSIAPSRGVDEGDEGVTDLAFTVSMDKPSDREVTVAWDVSGTAEAGTDYTAPTPALVTFPALSWDPQRIVFGVIGDTDPERNETVAVDLRDPTGGAVLGTSRATAEIRNDEELVLSVDPPEVVEGDSRSDRARLTFRLTLTDSADTDVTVDYRVESDAGTATAGSDFKDKSGTVTIRSGQTFAVVKLGILEDTDFEPDETVVMVFENPQGAVLEPSSTRVTGTILNDDLSQVTADTVVAIAAASGAVTEGEDAVFVLTRTGDASAPLTVTVEVSQAGSVLAGTTPTSATFGTNETQATLRVATEDDAVDEADGRVTAAAVAGAGYMVAPGAGSAAVAVFDNDGLSAATVVAIAAESGAVTEGEDAVFVLTRTGDASAPLTVTVEVSQAGSVLAGAAPAAAVFGANETEARLRVATEDDAVDEADGRVTAAAVAGADYMVAPGAGSAAVDVLDNDDPAAPGEPALLWSTTMTVVDFGNAVGASGSDLPDRGWSEGGVDYMLDRLKWFEPPKGLVRVRFSRRPAAADELTLRAGALSLPLAEGGSGRVFRWPVEGAPWPVGAEVELRLTRAAAGEDHDGAAGAGISVADARVHESAGTPLAFRVTLDEARTSAVSVRYATSDGSATAGADYVAASGVVRFEAGETVKTVHVAVLEDAHDEGEETMTLTLSSPFGAEVSDGVATGTIVNTDAMPRAWLGRFGRTVAGQVVDAVEARMTAARRAGVEVSIAGRSVGAAGAFDEAATRGGGAAGGRPAGWLAGENGPEGLDMVASRDAALAGGRLAEWFGVGVDAEERTVSGRALLAGTSFARTEGTAESGFVSVWGRGVVTDFDGRDGELSVDGEVATGLLGADWARDDWAAGLIVGHSQGEGSYRSGQGAGTVSSSLTGLYPWGRRALNDRVTAWGVAGYGQGTLTLEPEGGARIETDMDLAMAAAGLRGVLVEAPAEGGLELAAKTDGLIVRSASDGAQGSDGGMLEAASAKVTRLRLGLEGTRAFRSEDGWTLTPSFGLGVRHDGGDAETGFGVEVGAGVAYAAPSSGVTADLRGRGLLGHEASGFREFGLSGSLAFDPSPSSDRGLSLSLSQTLGASATGGVDALYGRDTMAGLGGADAGAGAVDSAGRRRLEARAGYGVSVFGGRFTGTPELGFGLSESGRDYRLGWRLTPAGGNAGSFEFGVEATRREAANGDESEHELGVRATIRW